eukprot:1433932-Alexandrium_andersonii.AAC.1
MPPAAISGQSSVVQVPVPIAVPILQGGLIASPPTPVPEAGVGQAVASTVVESATSAMQVEAPPA